MLRRNDADIEVNPFCWNISTEGVFYYFANKATDVKYDTGLLKCGKKKKSVNAKSSTVICF